MSRPRNGFSATPPALAVLRNTPCSLEEVQAALVKLTDEHNSLVNFVNDLIRSGRIRPLEEARGNTRFTL